MFNQLQVKHLHKFTCNVKLAQGRENGQAVLWGHQQQKISLDILPPSRARRTVVLFFYNYIPLKSNKA